jgi:hypothetical protein
MTTKLKLARLGLTGVLLAGMAVALALQQQSLNRLRHDNLLLRQQLEDLLPRAEQLAAENQRLSTLTLTPSNQPDAGPASPPQPSSELLRLRGEVTRLHSLEKDTEQSLRAQMQAAQEKLTNAQVELARVTRLRVQGAVSAAELSEARFAVELLQAEAKGDTAEAARVRLRQAEEELARAEQLRSNSLISQNEYDEAVRKVAALRAGTGP